ncbi:hypothetical protein [uncultured Thiohalocapsa sp.]|uniref:hypothetical protein n=1 Tax=uncultured Thiohalocapsa sp. TaxID=768990 RepID=UPI0025EF0569|nr:hypothetical protein [uncultured Thiohalocapsa sp.]
MTKSFLTLSTALFFGLMLSVGGAVAGDGKSCGGKKKDGDTAVVISPAKPLA